MIEDIKKIKINAWYRGMKEIKFVREYKNTYYMSNGDKIKFNDNEIYINNELVSNDDISFNNFLYIYKNILKTKGYKFI